MYRICTNARLVGLLDLAEALLGGGALLLRLADEGVGVVRHDELAVRRLHLPNDSDK